MQIFKYFNKKCTLLNFIRTKHSAAKMSTGDCTIAVCQLTSTNDKNANLSSIKTLVAEAAEKHAKIVFLPEASDYIATSKTENKELAEDLNGPLVKEYKILAQEHNVWLSIGGMHEIVSQNGNSKMHNCHVVINNKGDIVTVYRKLHLFDVTIPEKNVYLKESDYIAAGQTIVDPVETPAGLLGLSICYDLRFPELSTLLRKKGAEILTFPSAFTNSTGQAHWETLLRARAIENQCYVVAAAQYGEHNIKRISYGQAMIIDPWGKILAECPKYSERASTNESVAVATINRKLVSKIRKEMPVFSHRRNDLYELREVGNSPQEVNQFMFSNKVIPSSTVFYTTKYSYAFTNIRCVVPGHVLVSSLRPAKRLEDLSPEETSDLFLTAQKVQKAVELKFSAESSTICVQDGKHAGQTVSHVHVHIMPRKEGDFDRNDDIYMELAKHDKDSNPAPVRSIEEMATEASMLKDIMNTL